MSLHPHRESDTHEIPQSFLLVSLRSSFSAPARSRGGADAPPDVAVLPLANNSGDAAQDFFAGGLTDEIAVALTAVAGLDVVARSSAFLVKADDLKGIGEKLHARYLVQGTARLADGRVRLAMRLFRPPTARNCGRRITRATAATSSTWRRISPARSPPR